MGINAVQSIDGTITTGTGTSFSAPIISGLAACLWQSMPQMKAIDVVKAIRSSAYRDASWNSSRYGYGIQNLKRAWQSSAIPRNTSNITWKVWPNPFTSSITIDCKDLPSGLHVSIDLYNASGTRVWTQKSDLPATSDNMSDLPQGIYILTIDVNNTIKTLKLIKQ